MGWVSGELPFLSPPDLSGNGSLQSNISSQIRRSLQSSVVGGSNSSDVSNSTNPSIISDGSDADESSLASLNSTSDNGVGLPLPEELLSLLNTIITLLIAVAFTALVQLSMVWLWRNRINRRFYLERDGEIRVDETSVPPPGTSVVV